MARSLPESRVGKRVSQLVVALGLFASSRGLENKVFAETINVPQDYTKIQEAIDASHDGDEIIVSPGRYVENIHFDGKKITLRSTNPKDKNIVEQTIIDGNKLGSVVTFSGDQGSTCTLEGFTITNGSGTNIGYGQLKGGGGIYISGGSPNIENCIITKNISNNGGGLYLTYNASSSIFNCLIVNNISTTYWFGSTGGFGAGFGGGITGGNSVNKLINCTLIDNHYVTNGVLYDFKGDIVNCIIWSPHQSTDLANTSTPKFSCIPEWRGGGEGNVSLDPQFVDSDNGDFHLKSTSPCIDAGTTIGDLLYDFDGISRPQGSGYDIGAYEFISRSLIDNKIWKLYE